MRNSRISSIARDSNIIHYDVITASVANVAAGAASTSGTSLDNALPRSKVLAGAKANPNTNEGLVHLIRRIWWQVQASSTTVISARHSTAMQIARRATGAFQTPGTDMVVWEDNLVAPVGIQAFAQAGQVVTDVYQSGKIELQECPIIMVKPYYLNVTSNALTSGAGTITTSVTLRMMVETIRVKGEEYRRLLDGYTQIPGRMERAE